MLDLIRENTRAAELLADTFDFDITRTDHCEEVHLASGGALHPVAGDAAGGTFFICDEGPVLYASSEGSAGILAPDLTTAITVLTAIPTWHDVVSAAPDLVAMRTAFDESYAELKEYEPDVETHRAELAKELTLPTIPVDELLFRLQTSLTDLSPRYTLLNEEGDPYDAL